MADHNQVRCKFEVSIRDLLNKEGIAGSVK